MNKNLSIFTLLAIFATNLFADDQKTIEIGETLFAPVEIKMSYREAKNYCSNLNINNHNGWRLAKTHWEISPIVNKNPGKKNWTWQDVNFAYEPDQHKPHFFICMNDSKKVMRESNEYQQSLKNESEKQIRESNEYQEGLKNNSKNNLKQNQNQVENLGSNKLHSEEHFARIIKESNEYQESLKRNPTAEAKSVTQTKKRFFKDSNLPDCTDQNLTNCYGNLKINSGSFEGELADGTFEGKGLIVNSNGGAFIGNFKNNEFISGLDIYTNANEFFRLRDEAIEKNLSEDGRLKYILENFRGKYYMGSFINNKRDGKGMYVDTIEGFSQNGSWKNDEFTSGDTQRFGQNNSNQNTPMSRAQSQCDSYGFQKGTNPYAQCIMQMDQLIRQQDYEQQRRANIEFQCRMQKANSFLSYQTPFFVESLNRADQVYNNCMAGLPPPRSGKIDCTISGSNVYCQER